MAATSTFIWHKILVPEMGRFFFWLVGWLRSNSHARASSDIYCQIQAQAYREGIGCQLLAQRHGKDWLVQYQNFGQNLLQSPLLQAMARCLTFVLEGNCSS